MNGKAFFGVRNGSEVLTRHCADDIQRHRPFPAAWTYDRVAALMFHTSKTVEKHAPTRATLPYWAAQHSKVKTKRSHREYVP